MKRDWDIVRQKLLATEEIEAGSILRPEDFSPGKAYETAYHVKIMNEAGLLDVNIIPIMSSAPKPFLIRSLSWEGHEFLDAIRSETIWGKTKQTILEKGSTLTFDLIKSVAISFATKALES